MDNLIFLIIAGVAFVINTVLNYNKEQKKNAQRSIKQQNKPAPTFGEPQRRIEILPTTPSNKRKTERVTPPSTPKTQFLNTIEGSSSLNSEIMNKSNEFQTEEDIYQEVDSISLANQHDEIGDENPHKYENKRIRIETRDDFKRAIIYSTILERKY